MRILVTGCEGFTGHYFKQAAEAEGHEVLPLTVDLTDAQAVLAQVAGLRPEWVAHFAAISFVGHANESAFYAVNTIGSVNLLAALVALPMPPSKVLMASSANVYGNCEASPISETQAPAPVNHYAMSKLAMEQSARTYMDRLPIVLTRPFNYTGVGQAAQFVIPKLVNHFASGAARVELGNLHVEREYNDVRRVASVCLALLEKGVAGEIYNICTGQTHTLHDVLAMLGQLSGRTLDVQVNPEFVRKNEVHRLCGNPGKLNRVLRSASVPVEQFTLLDTLSWMLAEAGKSQVSVSADSH